MKKIIKNIKANYGLILIVLASGVFLGWLLFHPTKADSANGKPVEGHEGHDHSAEDPTTWTCSMHPQIKQDRPGQCPICAMDLIPLATNQAAGQDMNPDEIALSEAAAQLANIETVPVSRGYPQKLVQLQGRGFRREKNWQPYILLTWSRLRRSFWRPYHLRKAGPHFILQQGRN